MDNMCICVLGSKGGVYCVRVWVEMPASLLSIKMWHFFVWEIYTELPGADAVSLFSDDCIFATLDLI
jgi:hypothetical protein